LAVDELVAEVTGLEDFEVVFDWACAPTKRPMINPRMRIFFIAVDG